MGRILAPSGPVVHIELPQLQVAVPVVITSQNVALIWLPHWLARRCATSLTAAARAERRGEPRREARVLQVSVTLKLPDGSSVLPCVRITE